MRTYADLQQLRVCIIKLGLAGENADAELVYCQISGIQKMRQFQPGFHRTRFVMVKDDTSIGRLRVILNWHADAAGTAAR